MDENIINQSSRGITAINISRFPPCKHSFIAYLDKNLSVRDCFVMDFQIELPEMEPAQIIDDMEIPDSETVDIDLIKDNIPALPLTYLIRSFFYGQEILFLHENESVYSHIENVLQFLSKGTFKNKFSIKGQLDYKKNKKHFKNHVVFDSHKTINDKNKILNPKDIKIERRIIQKFLAEIDPKSSLIILKNEVQKAFELSKLIVDYLDVYDKNEDLLPKVISNYLSKKLGQNINEDYLKFLIQIITKYHRVNFSTMLDFSLMTKWIWYLK